MRIIQTMDEACDLLEAGQVIAYPTEAVYGLGCDMFHAEAVSHLLALKQRPEDKGVIVLVANWEQVWPLVERAAISKAQLEAAEKTWPGFVTWVFPKSKEVPSFISGGHPGIAIRMSAHPVAHALCRKGPIVSTSANVAGLPPARDIHALSQFFPEGVSGVVAGDLGGNFAVSEIYNILDGSALRRC